MDPLTIMAGISAVGTLFKGISGFFGGNAKAKAEKAAAQQAGAEAGVAASQAIEQGNAVAAQGAVQAAVNGGGFVGSSLGVISDLSRRALFNARAAAYRGATEVQQHLYQAKIDKAQGVNDLTSSLFGAAGSLYKGGAQSQAASAAQMALMPATPSGGDASDLAGLY